MIEALATQAEMRAQEAEDLPAFSGIKLLHIKRQVDELLSLIGRNGIFDEYTRHDISHVDEMLEILDWLVPEDTEAIMSPADWLLTVLAIYFHDLGMLVTIQEYEARNSSGFPEYRDNVLFAGDTGADYRAKVEQLPPDKVDRFLYQEFVRHKHAERIRNWIMGRAPEHLGTTHAAMSEVEALLNPLDLQFRRDLALVCESHHLTDLNDFQKYKVAQPYGNSDEETANLQFAAVLLRTTDLLHITRDRTPSVAFRMINPTDPLSQEEWAKQMAVKRVRSQLGRDREGNPDENAPRDTIEVHAYFTRENGFFGLTSYLLYAQKQIRRSYGWVQEANKLKAARHEFPWRFIDDSNIQTEGFLRDTFEFAIDQPKILDLLTGHTLYNDTRIVLRELVQNSLDAIRLQNLIDQQAGSTAQPGSMKIHWDSQQRILSVEDNGTGMTQDIIERHLLKVGASRYQDPEFQRQHPGFSPISRFGIGILSAFMVADTVEIVTCHADDEQARQLSLRSVHGKYLIRLLDKQTDEPARRLAPRGTLVKLKVRPSAEMPDVIETAQRWIVVPDCEVSVTVDDDPPVQVGFSSPREAVLQVLEEIGLSVDDDSGGAGRRKVRVEQKEVPGVTLAYAVEWSEYFREWSFLQLPRAASAQETHPLLGTCVEGVRVEFDTPGFDDRHIVAIANTAGPNAPKTNVVRSGLEATPGRDTMLRAVYSLYCDHVRSEMRELNEKRQFSLTWATQEARYLLSPLLSPYYSRLRVIGSMEALDSSLLIDEVGKLPVLLVESGGQRRAVSPDDFRRERRFWTIDCGFFRSAEMLIREVPSAASLSALIDGLHASSFQLPDDPVLCGSRSGSILDEYTFEGKEVDAIRIHREQRRVDLRWAERTDPPRWRGMPEDVIRLSRDLERFVAGQFMAGSLVIGQAGLETVGVSDEIAVRSSGSIYVFPDSQVAQYVLSWLDRLHRNRTDGTTAALTIIFNLVHALLLSSQPVSNVEERVGLALRRYQQEGVLEMVGLRVGQLQLEDAIDLPELYDFVGRANWKIFDPSAWVREKAS